MKCEYDKSADAAYIYVTKTIADGSVKKSVEVSEGIIFDYDKDNKLVGIEILDASTVMQKSLLSQATIPSG